VLVSGIDERLKQIITEGCKEHQAEIMSMEIMPDHVHLLLECDPPLGDSVTGSSPQRTLIPAFTPGVSSIGAQITDVVDQLVFVSTVGGAPLTVIKQYIENQKHV
jgi:putative transposase